MLAAWSLALDGQDLVGRNQFVGTWTLISQEQQGIALPYPRGLLIHDSAGHALEIVTQGGRAAYDQLSKSGSSGGTATTSSPVEALRAFESYAGFWGTFAIDRERSTITYIEKGDVHPSRTGLKENVIYQESGDRLVLTRRRDDATGSRTIRSEWERLPDLTELNATQRMLVGFWEWTAEERVDARGGVVASTSRAPSVIVYTPTGHVAVHFVPGGRTPFAAATPTGEEARAAISAYVSYFGTYGIYPESMVRHYLLVSIDPAGNGNIYPRLLNLREPTATLTLPPTTLNGVEVRNRVTVKRLSGWAEMSSRP